MTQESDDQDDLIAGKHLRRALLHPTVGLTAGIASEEEPEAAKDYATQAAASEGEDSGDDAM